MNIIVNNAMVNSVILSSKSIFLTIS